MGLKSKGLPSSSRRKNFSWKKKKELEEKKRGSPTKRSSVSHKCDICEKTFNIRGNLNVHMKRVHGNH